MKENSVCILKFGGTSVGDGERISRVAAIISDTVHTKEPHTKESHFPVVVVSAMSGVTDQLLRIAKLACNGQATACEQELASLRQRHLNAAQIVTADDESRVSLLNELNESLSALTRDVQTLREAASTGDMVHLRTAAVASWGERLSVSLVAAAVNRLGTAAAPVRQEVIVTSHPAYDPEQSFGVVVGADPLAVETRAKAHAIISPLVERRVVPVACGFIGRTITGYVTTLGRNGSDYSATVIGAALDCAEVSIYTDVDGVLSADPRLVSNSRLLTHLSYAEAARLSWFGAKVLHPRTLIPIAARGIPVRVRNTFHPHIRGTVIGPVGRMPSGAGAITVRRKLALVTVESTDLFGAPENAGQVFDLAARAGAAPIAICSSSGHHLSFLVDESSAKTVVGLLQQNMDTSLWTVRCRHNLAACACIGSGFTSDPMCAARASSALAGEHIPVITQGASIQGVTFVVEDRHSESALRCLHRDLIAPVIPMLRHPVQNKTVRREVQA